MAVAPNGTPRCSNEEWEHFRWMCSHGMLFEVIEWIDCGKPTLRPAEKKASAFQHAIVNGNHSLVKTLWERAWQDEDEAIRAVEKVDRCGSNEVFRYAVEAGCPLDRVKGYALFKTHDLDLIRAGLDRGINLAGPEGFAEAFLSFGSRPLIRFYIEERDKRPGLIREAAEAMAEAIRESKQRAIALLKWAGVDPFMPIDDNDETDEEPNLYLPYCAISELPHSQEPDETLETLKLRPDSRQWLGLLQSVAGVRSDLIHTIFDLRPDGEDLLKEDAIRAGSILDSFFHELASPSPWQNDFYGDYLIEEICLMLVSWRIPLFAGADTNIDRERRAVMRHGVLPKPMPRILRAAWNVGDEAQRQRLRQFADKPKMLDLVKNADRGLHALLGFARRRSNPQKVPAGCKSFSRERIHRDVWKQPASKVASRYGISSSMLSRICTELNIPRPGRGHWAKPEERRAEAPPLPPAEDGAPARWVIDPANRARQISKE